MKLFYLVLFSLIGQLSYAQCNEKLVYSESEKESFVRVYLSTKKDKPKTDDSLLYDLLIKYEISAQQFKEIQHPSESRRPLSDSEIKFVFELQKLKEAYESEKKAIEEGKCNEFALDSNRYLAMQHQYKSCMKFQRSLSDYFSKWMK